jgi:hypothetical protein
MFPKGLVTVEIWQHRHAIRENSSLEGLYVDFFFPFNFVSLPSIPFITANSITIIIIQSASYLFVYSSTLNCLSYSRLFPELGMISTQ